MRKDVDMLRGPLLPAVIRYTIPIILTSVLQLLFNAADLVVVGRFCGSNSVAAVGNTSSLIHLFTNLFIGLSVGVGVSVAQGLGAKDSQMVHRTVHSSMPLALVGSVILTALGIGLSGPMLRLMGTPEEVLPLSALYMKIYFGGITFSMIYNFCAAILRAAGDTKSPLIYLTLAGFINVGLNLVFVTVLHMDVAGVAWATTISQGVSAVLVAGTLMRRRDDCRLELKKMRFYKIPLIKTLQIGVPAGLQSSLFAISNVIIQSSINSFGALVMAGSAAANNVEGFVYVSMNAFHQTALNFTGRCVGAGDRGRVKKVLATCLGCVALLGVSVGVLGRLFAPQLLSMYLTDAPDAIRYGEIRMTYIMLTYAICGMMDVSTGSLRGMGVSLTPTLISIFGVCGLRIGWITTVFQIPQFHTPESLYISYPISWVLTFAAQIIAFSIFYKRKKQ